MKHILTAALAALALGAAQAVTVSWDWDNCSAPTNSDRWEVTSDNAKSFSFTVPQFDGIAAGTNLTVTELVFGIHNDRDALVGTVTIANAAGDTIGTVSGFADNGEQLYTANAGNNRTPNGQSATVAGITLVVGETYTFTFSEGSCFALIQTDVTATEPLTGDWVVAMGLRGTYDNGVPIPEPTALALLALGAAGVALRRRAA